MSRLTAVVIGANGQLGSDVVSWWSSQGVGVVPLTHAEIAIEEIDSVRSVLGAHRPDIVLSTAAFHNVPKCEEDPARSHAVNSLGALNLARTCASLGSTLAYVSTDYVFDGAQRRPYLETDAPNPLNVYGGHETPGRILHAELCAAGVRVQGLRHLRARPLQGQRRKLHHHHAARRARAA